MSLFKQEKNSPLTPAEAYAIVKITMTDREVLAKIEAYLRKNNLRQYELAQRLGIPPSTINRWLKGKANISKSYRYILEKEGII